MVGVGIMVAVGGSDFVPMGLGVLVGVGLGVGLG